MSSTPLLPGALRLSNQREAAREAGRECARRFRLELGDFPRDECGLPRPVAGWHWSLSHGRHWVAAVVHPEPVALALERVQVRRQELVRAAVRREELECLGGFRWERFARLLSAKRAVLGLAGARLARLSELQLVTPDGARGLVLHDPGRGMIHVHQRLCAGHWISLASAAGGSAELAWDWDPRAPRGGPG
jgi:hypothetical protein